MLKKTRLALYVLVLMVAMCGCAQVNEPAQSTVTAAPAETQTEAQEDSDGAALAVEYGEIDPGYSDRDRAGTYDESDAVSVTLSDEGIAVEGVGATAAGSVLTISDEGVYLLSGSLSDGRVVVDAENSDKVQLVLCGVSIHSEDGPAIEVKQADKVFITLADGSENSLSDGQSYALADGEDEPNACIYSKDDLTLNGPGKLTINGNYRHGINSKDDLIITGGVIDVTAVEDGLRGKDGVGIAGGEITVTAGEDGLHSSGVTDEADKGWISLDGGILTVTAGSDGIQAATVLQVRGGTISLTTGGGADNAEVKQSDFGGMSGFGSGRGQRPDQDGLQRDENGNMPGDRPVLPDGAEPGNRTELPEGEMQDLPVRPDDAMMGEEMQPPEGFDPGVPEGDAPDGQGEADNAAETVSTSAKGLKSDGAVLVLSGSVTADCADDTIHAVQVTLVDGVLSLASGDDGVHADDALTILGGTIDITRSYEGLEGGTIDISGGDIHLVSSDDGLNAAGGSDGEEATGRWGMDTFAAQDGVYINISGGTLTVDASGDGIDSNGDLTISGGAILVYGPTSGGDGALDYNGSAAITGGTVVALGAQGMAMNFGSDSTQCSVLVSFPQTVRAGSEMTLTDDSGNEILRFTVDKEAQCVVLSCPELMEGQTYTLLCDGESLTTFKAALPTGSGEGMMGGHGGRR